MMRTMFFCLLWLWAGVFCFRVEVVSAETAAAEYVIMISFDGLRADALTRLGKDALPHFHQAMREGAFTLNARTDPDRTNTMPNHTSMITGRGVMGSRGHNFTDNASADLSIHAVKGKYVPSVFDQATRHGLRTGLFASKSKFRVFLNSYDRPALRPMSSVINVSSINQDDDATLLAWMKSAQEGLPQLVFLHLADLDKTGHAEGWDVRRGSPYGQALVRQDRRLGEIMSLIERDERYRGKTVLMITTDHGGHGKNHQDIAQYDNYRIPVIIWGKGIAQTGDLYTINAVARHDPGHSQVAYGEKIIPVRNGDLANGAMHLLGLPSVEDSTIGYDNPLRAAQVNTSKL